MRDEVRGLQDGQQAHWEKMLDAHADLFGAEPSEAARIAAEAFQREGARAILELGGGQGRDALFFAREGFGVSVLEYARSGVDTINGNAQSTGLAGSVKALWHDVRVPLPFEDETFDGCFSHMLFCMALTMVELRALSAEVCRVLRPGGLHVYTARNTEDAHYGTGTHRGEDLYEHGGFIVHFFSEEKVQTLSKGFEIIGIDRFEEGELPRKLFRVTLRKRCS